MGNDTLTAVDAAHAIAPLPWLVTISVLARLYRDSKTPGAIRMDVFKAEDRRNSRGELIKGNGLASHGAIIRNGRKVLIRPDRYGRWLAGLTPAPSEAAILENRAPTKGPASPCGSKRYGDAA